MTETASRTPKEEFSARNKWLRQYAGAAGVDVKQFGGQLKTMDRVMHEAAKEEYRYLDAVKELGRAREALDRIPEDAYAPETVAVRQDLDTIKDGLKWAAKNWFTSEEAQWRQSLIRVEDAGQMFLQPGRIRPAKDPAAEELKSAAQILKERLDECIPAGAPDFYEKAEEIPGLKNNIGQAIKKNDEEFISRREAVLAKLGTVAILLDSGRLNKKSIRRAIKSLLPAMKASIDPMAEAAPEAEDEEKVDIFALPGILLGIVKRYFPAQKANLKAQKKYDKAKAKYDKKVAKGKSALEPAQPDLVDLDAIKNEMRAEMKKVSGQVNREIDFIKNKDPEQSVSSMLKLLEKLELGKL